LSIKTWGKAEKIRISTIKSIPAEEISCIIRVVYYNDTRVKKSSVSCLHEKAGLREHKVRSNSQVLASVKENLGGNAVMINYEEELSKFKPSKEIDQAEDVIVNMNLRDMTDIMLEILKEKERQ